MARRAGGETHLGSRVDHGSRTCVPHDRADHPRASPREEAGPSSSGVVIDDVTFFATLLSRRHAANRVGAPLAAIHKEKVPSLPSPPRRSPNNARRAPGDAVPRRPPCNPRSPPRAALLRGEATARLTASPAKAKKEHRRGRSEDLYDRSRTTSTRRVTTTGARPRCARGRQNRPAGWQLPGVISATREYRDYSSAMGRRRKIGQLGLLPSRAGEGRRRPYRNDPIRCCAFFGRPGRSDEAAQQSSSVQGDPGSSRPDQNLRRTCRAR